MPSVPPAVDFNTVSLVYALVATFRLVFELKESDILWAILSTVRRNVSHG